MSEIKTGDTVLHRPTGEHWTVAYVQGKRLAWCGYPEGEADLTDCELLESCSEEERITTLRNWAKPNLRSDARGRYAYRTLVAEGLIEADPPTPAQAAEQVAIAADAYVSLGGAYPPLLKALDVWRAVSGRRYGEGNPV